MKFTLSWLREHLDTDATVETICTTLTKIGLEVEGLVDPAARLKDFVIAHVVEAVQHPNADRLRVCKVDLGNGEPPLQVVCGAPNARTGMKSVFSPPGTYIPGKDITISKGIIRGVESAGMLCSDAELELSSDSDGIIELPADAPVGAVYIDWLGTADPVIEINLTPNRPDCTSIHGIARDLAAAGLGKLKGLEPKGIKGQFPCPVQVKLDFTENHAMLCPVFALRLVRGVKNGPSPAWMQNRLKAIGLRPINALVDITNYMTFDRGRPLHVFDADKVKGHLAVRRAHNGEQVMALDGRTYKLDEGMVVIADDNGVESIAGIMGGEHSGCDENTVNVLIESALWDPLNIAQTGRKLGIITDARYRFERGVDPAFALPGCELATQWVMDICGGTPSDMLVAGEVPVHGKIIDFPWSETKRLTGVDVHPVEQKVILQSLGFWVSGTGDRVKVAAPSWRPDVEGKADLAEEVIRIVGFEKIKPEPFPPQTAVNAPVLTLLQKRTRAAKRLLAARGMVEAVTWSFVSEKQATLFGRSAAMAPKLRLINPIAAELSDMRPSLLPGLLSSAQRNADRGASDVALFEVGQIFMGDGETEQKIAATGVRRGQARASGTGRHWSDAAKDVDFFDAKADVMALLAGLGVSLQGLQVVQGGPSWLHPGRSATLQFGPQNQIGCVGELHPRLLKELDISGPHVAFEILLDAIPAPKIKPTKVKPKLEMSDFQHVTRDFAFIVDAATRADDLLKIARGIDRTLVSDVVLFDVYDGKGIEPGKKSLGLELTIQPKDKTLTDAEIDAVAQKLVAEAAKKLGAALRG
ncbi:MAG: phenylalanine--tRNA ligase subunit beta [Beijerinckiaceae bacterium]